MPAVLVDLCIEARWIVPMTVPGRILNNHTLVVRDGRILDLLPSAAAAERYAATVLERRPEHLLMPGMVNAATHAAHSLFRAMPSTATPAATARSIARFAESRLGPEFVRDGAATAIAEMLRSGITCFADRCYFPDETARVASEQGLRAVIGLPVAEKPSLWAKTSADYFTRGLQV